MNRLRQALCLLLISGALVLAVVCVRNLLRPEVRGVAEAEAELTRARAKFEKAMSAVKKANRLAQKVAPPNSPLDRAVQSAGQAVIQKCNMDLIVASVDASIARTIAAADYCLQTFRDFNKAQEAMAALRLSGVQDVIVRKPEGSLESDEPFYNLMVPSAAAERANSVLQNVRITQLKVVSGLPGVAGSEIQRLEKQGIPATVCALKTSGGDMPRRAHALYVRCEDEEAARSLLSRSQR